MTLFTKEDCQRCQMLKDQFDLKAMQINIEVLDQDDADALAHLAWHGLVETARKTLPILVLDDCSTVDDFIHIEHHLLAKANQFGIACRQAAGAASCEAGSCSL